MVGFRVWAVLEKPKVGNTQCIISNFFRKTYEKIKRLTNSSLSQFLPSNANQENLCCHLLRLPAPQASSTASKQITFAFTTSSNLSVIPTGHQSAAMGQALPSTAPDINCGQLDNAPDAKGYKGWWQVSMCRGYTTGDLDIHDMITGRSDFLYCWTVCHRERSQQLHFPRGGAPPFISCWMKTVATWNWQW